jgi:hypothetical protein
MFTAIITDCKSENAKGRQVTRFNSLGLGPVSFVGIDSNFGDTATIEASGNLIDVLNACDGKICIVVVNVAPRGDKQPRVSSPRFSRKSSKSLFTAPVTHRSLNKSVGENGNSFCYFYYKETLVITTTSKHTFSFIKQFRITNKVNILDAVKVLKYTVRKNLINQSPSNQITISQFRSFDFVPLVAKWLVDGVQFPSISETLTAHDSLPTTIWCIDAFGNCKTTLSATSNKRQVTRKIKTNLGEFIFYKRLKGVPKGETAIYIGSSGIGNKRFLEIATQGIPGSAAKTLNLKIGDEVKML